MRNLKLVIHNSKLLWIALNTIAIGAFTFALVGQLGTLASYPWQVEPPYLAAAALIALARGPVVVYPWWRIVTGWGFPLGWGRAMRLYIHSGLARYLPGQWWFVLGRTHLAEREGVRPAVTGASTIVETVMLLGSAFVVAILGLATVPIWWQSAPLYLLALALLAPVALLASPPLLARLTDRILRWRGYEPLASKLRFSHAAQALLGCCLNWLMYGLVAALLLAALTGGAYVGDTPATIGIFTASVLGGSVFLFVPQGIVVREGVLVYLLSSLLGVPVPIALAVAALTRVVVTAAEGAWALVGLRL